MDRATEINTLRELTDHELAAVGGGSAIWGGVGEAIGWSLLGPAVVVAAVALYLISPTKAY